MSYRRYVAMSAIAVFVLACSGATGSSPIMPTPSTSPSPIVDPSTTAGPSAPLKVPWIAYMTGGISRVEPDGSHGSEIIRDGPVPSPAHPDLAPDGRLAFQAGADASWDIWIADVDGLNPRVLVKCTSPCINLDAPAWSPDGKTIAFSRLDQIGDALPSKLQLVDVASGAVTTIADTPSGDYVTGPRWSPDGRRLVATYEYHKGPDGKLVEKPIDSRIAVISVTDQKPAFSFLTKAGMEASYPDWHPTHDLIVFQAGSKIVWDSIGESRGNIFTIRSDGSDLRQLANLAQADRATWMPTWGADGTTILVTLTVRSTRENTIAQLMADGSGLADLPGPVRGAHPRQQRLR